MYPAPPVTRTRIRGSRALLREQSPARSEADQIYGGVRIELAQDPPAVCLHGARADAQLLRDLRRRVSLDAELEDFALARGERRQRRTHAVVSAAQTPVVGDHEAG